MSKQPKPVHTRLDFKPAGQRDLSEQVQLRRVVNHNSEVVVRCQSRAFLSNHPFKQGDRVVETGFTKLNRLFNPRNGERIGMTKRIRNGQCTMAISIRFNDRHDVALRCGFRRLIEIVR